VHVAWKAGTRAGSRRQAARTATTPTAAPAPLSPLLRELWRRPATHRPAVRQARCVDRLRALVLHYLCTATHHRLVSHARLDYAVLSAYFLQETLAQMPE
jgi:hypothetical protein